MELKHGIDKINKKLLTTITLLSKSEGGAPKGDCVNNFLLPKYIR